MKCPYRTKLIYFKPVTPLSIVKTSEGNVTISLVKMEDYEDCCGEECPFYCDSGMYRSPVCLRVENETGGDCL